MKKITVIFLFALVMSSVSNAQWQLAASMGLDFYSAPPLRDYINSSFPANQISTFKSAVAFTGEADYSLTNTFQIGVEYNILLDSYNSPVGPGGIYELSYTEHRPSALAYYVIPGQGYQFKFGGGFGYRYVSLTEKIFSSTNYSSSGFGVVLKAEGLTLLGGNFYANVGVQLRYDFPGELSNNGTYIVNNYNNERLTLNSLGVGIKLGVAYLF